VIRLNNVTKTYESTGRVAHALAGVSLHVRQGEIFGIIGRSGAGKSTLIRMLNLLERPTRGEVWVSGKDITRLGEGQLREFRRKVGMVFQHFNLLRSRTVLDNVCFPLKLAGASKAQQRVGIARALASRPELLLCDEATSALDPETTQSILRLLLDINRRLGLTIVLITHGMDVIRAVCDKVAVMDAGRIVESGDVMDVFLHPEHEVTQSLLSESGVDAEGWRDMAQSVPGRLLRLSFRGETTTQPILSRITRELGLNVSILQGAVSRIKDVPYGQLVIAIQGDALEQDKLDALLAGEGVRYEVLRA
jgi:D-methionine transport system ATP-binding protein